IAGLLVPGLLVPGLLVPGLLVPGLLVPGVRRLIARRRESGWLVAVATGRGRVLPGLFAHVIPLPMGAYGPGLGRCACECDSTAFGCQSDTHLSGSARCARARSDRSTGRR